MFYINDTFYDSDYVEACFDCFDANAIINQCKGKRFTVCLEDTALWIALCLYLKSEGGSVFPLPVGTPIDAARRRAEKSRSHYLLFGKNADDIFSNTEVVEVGGEDASAVLVQMSSGTTGEPKVIERSWCSIDAEMDAYLQHFPEANVMTPVVAAPVSHSYGLICGVLVAILRGITPVVVTNLNPKYILRKLQEVERPILYSSPTLITTMTMLLKTGQPIHAIMTSGTLIQGALFDKVKNSTLHLYQQYGCSEVGCISLGKDIRSYNDIGMPLPHQKVVTGKDISSAAEIIVSNNQEGEVATKDLGYMDGTGNLRFVSRIDDMINVAGLNVYPGEVEESILTMPAIADAVVFKRNHSLGSDQVCLHFVADTDIAPADIRQWCRNQLAAHQIPMYIKRVEKIHKLPNGKVNRKKLAETV